jgi:hypothetical protein
MLSVHAVPFSPIYTLFLEWDYITSFQLILFPFSRVGVLFILLVGGVPLILGGGIGN